MSPRLMRHYKGGLYVLLDFAPDSTNSAKGATYAVYYSLRDERLRVRRTQEFIEQVAWPDGMQRPRFIPVESTE